MILRIIATTLNGVCFCLGIYVVAGIFVHVPTEPSIPLAGQMYGAVVNSLTFFAFPAINILAIWQGRSKPKDEAVPKV